MADIKAITKHDLDLTMLDFDLVMKIDECKRYITALRIELQCKPIRITEMRDILGRLIAVKRILTTEQEERQELARLKRKQSNQMGAKK